MVHDMLSAQVVMQHVWNAQTSSILRQALTQKESMKAATEVSMEQHKEGKAASTKELSYVYIYNDNSYICIYLSTYIQYN